MNYPRHAARSILYADQITGTIMGQRVGAKLYYMGDGYYAFTCPGCGMDHRVNVLHENDNEAGPWSFNGNCALPTFYPSIDTSYSYKDRPHRCHSWVRDGTIEFLTDSTHELAGQTVPLPDWDE